MLSFYILLFLVCCAVIYFSSDLIVGGLARIARFLGWREFVVAFFVMAFAASLPNLFVGISSIFHQIPILSFGEIVGGNVVDLSLAIALAVLISNNLPAESKMVQTSAIFTVIIAILPLLLILDGVLGRGDGIVLILAFVFYFLWLFSKRERFTKIYEERKNSAIKEFRGFIKDIGKIVFGLIILLLAAEGIVLSAKFFASGLGLDIALIGILIVGLGNAMPEIYFTIVSARKGQNWMILGNLMGSVIVPATLVLGIVALISPIVIPDFSLFAIARFFLVISAIFFLIFVRTDSKITKKEAVFLLLIYVVFVLVEILTK